MKTVFHNVQTTMFFTKVSVETKAVESFRAAAQLQTVDFRLDSN